MGEIELCCACDNPTGRAGKQDDSLFVYHETIGDIGPFCEDCYSIELIANAERYGQENTTLRAQIAELEANAHTDEILLEASQEATQRQVERVRELTEWRPMETAPDEYCLVAYDSGLHLVTHGMESDQVVGEYGTPICWLPLPSPKKGGE